MNPGDSGYDLIIEELLSQKQRQEDLEDENNDLRRQLNDLREGRGILVEINDQRFAAGEAVPSSPETNAPVESSSATSQILSQIAGVSITPMIDIATPLSDSSQNQEGTPVISTPQFLEELLIDEVATAATTPIAVWTNISSKIPPQGIDEQEKAELRRELTGSFLLE